MAVEIVPQLTLIPISVTWEERMVALSGWYAEMGDTVKEKEVYDLLISYTPDYEVVREMGRE